MLGIDLGVTNIATDSDGTTHSGSTVKGVRYRQRFMTIYLPELPKIDLLDAVAPDLASLKGIGTILLVEDEDDLRAVVGRVLRSYGYAVLEASSGAAALALAQAQPTASSCC